MPKLVEPLNHKHLGALTYLAAGARDGDRMAGMGAALRLLAEQGLRIQRVSSIYETEPVDLPGDRALLNGAIQASTLLPPEDLLRACRAVEGSLGRKREAAPSAGLTRPDSGPRPIDLDILLYGQTVLTSPELILPHPRLHLRRFVLIPLAEIAPEARHPILGETIATLLSRCPDTAWVRPVAGPQTWMALPWAR